MAREIKIKVGLDTKEAETQAKDLGRKIDNALGQPRDALGRFAKSAESATLGLTSMRSAAIGLRGALAALGAVSAVSLFERFGRAAVDAAIGIDKQISSLRALTGSAEAAQKRFQELFKIAQATPGLTTNLAATLDTQLRIFNVAEKTINRLLPTIGRLNAISPFSDPRQFVNNLTQLISQNFERQDLKELVGQSPIAGRLLAEILNVDNPTNAAAVRAAAKKLGINTVERLAEELAKAGENNPALRNAVETLGGQFDKLQDRLNVALAPIGNEIAKTLIPIFDDLVKTVEKYGGQASRVFRDNRSEIVQASREVTNLVIALGDLTKAIFNLGSNKSGISNLKQELEDLVSLIVLAADISEGNLLTHPRVNALEASRRRSKEDRAKAISERRSESFVEGGRIDLSEESRLAAEAYARFRAGQTGRAPGLSFAGGGGERGITASQREAARERRDRAISRINIEALERNTQSRLNGANDATAELIKTYNAEIEARKKITESLQKLGDATTSMVSRGFSNLIRTGRREFNDANRDSARAYSLRLQGIDDLFNRGALSPEQAEALRQQAALGRASALNANLDGPNAKFIDRDDIQNLRDEAEQMTRLGTAISNTERFMRGFNSAIQTVGDSFDQFGQNVAQALTNTKDLLNGLKQALLSFFNGLLARSIQNVVGQALAPLAALFGGGGQSSFAGPAGNIFRTPPTVPQSITSTALQSILGGGSGAAPPSISSGGTVSLGSILRGIGGGGGSGIPISSGRAATTATAGGFSFGGLFESLGSAAPLLGLSIGAGLGGKSVGGNILGAAGGLLTSTFISTTLGAPGALGSLAPALFSNPLTAIAGAGLIVGGILLGKAKQRRQDEEASGDMLRQALSAIDQLASGVSSGQIGGSEARAIFENQILSQFTQGIRTLKTKSVVESRLTNQVRDLRNVFEARIPPLIAERERKAADARRFAAIDSRLIPQFATGGISRGGLAVLHDKEMVLTPKHQAAIAARTGQDIFRSVGVPGVQPNARFDNGGVYSASSSQAADTPVVIYLNAVVDAEGIFIKGGLTESGRQVIVKQNNATSLKKERR